MYWVVLMWACVIPARSCSLSIFVLDTFQPLACGLDFFSVWQWKVRSWNYWINEVTWKCLEMMWNCFQTYWLPMSHSKNEVKSNRFQQVSPRFCCAIRFACRPNLKLIQCDVALQYAQVPGIPQRLVQRSSPSVENRLSCYKRMVTTDWRKATHDIKLHNCIRHSINIYIYIYCVIAPFSY